MKSFFLAMAILPTIIWGDFVHEADFWTCLKDGDFESAENILLYFAENDLSSEGDGLRVTMLFIVLRSAEGNLNSAKWHLDREVRYWSMSSIGSNCQCSIKGLR